MKKKLLILSDLHGIENADWLYFYLDFLSTQFEIEVYDSLFLAGINANQKVEDIHSQFVNFGIDKAVQNLLKLNLKEFSVLAFSIGGTIAWKACHLGWKADALFLVSSTRLRLETQKPKSTIQLFYGDQDEFRPSENWLKHLQITPHLFENERHDFYKNLNKTKLICSCISDSTLL